MSILTVSGIGGRAVVHSRSILRTITERGMRFAAGNHSVPISHRSQQFAFGDPNSGILFFY